VKEGTQERDNRPPTKRPIAKKAGDGRTVSRAGRDKSGIKKKKKTVFTR